MVADDGDVRKFADRQCECLAPAENRIAGQHYHLARELHRALGFHKPGLKRCQLVVAGTDLGLTVERHTLPIAEAADDRQRGRVVSAGAISDIDDVAGQIPKVVCDSVECGCKIALFYPFQLKDAHVTDPPRPAIMKYPCLRRGQRTEAIRGQRASGNSEELPDLSVVKFLPESRLLLRTKVAFLAVYFGSEVNVPVIQRGDEPTQDIEQFLVRCRTRHLAPEAFVLLVPVDLSNF